MSGWHIGLALIFTMIMSMHTPLHAQELVSLNLNFLPTIEGAELQLQNEDSAKLTSKRHSSITKFQFYISNISLLNKGEFVWKDSGHSYLIDAAEKSGELISFNIPSGLYYDELLFSLGIDSLTNVSGAFGGDLDPSKGMYWTWQSGYVNCKLEGLSLFSSHAQKEFQFHLGGYAFPFASLKRISLMVHPTPSIKIGIDLDKFMAQVHWAEKSHVMSPSKEGVYLSTQLAESFFVKE
jgi:hypothetical protein